LRGYYFGGISVGVNLKGAFRIVPDYTDADDQGNNEGSLISGSGRSQSAAMAMADVGALTRFNFLKFYTSREQNFSASLAFRNLGPPVKGDPLPSVFTTGIAYKPLRPLLIAFDFTVPFNMKTPSESEKPWWAVGLSVQATSFLSMRAGFLGKAGGARVTIGSAIILSKLTLDLNYTLDLLTQLQPLNRVSLSVRFDLGDDGRKAIQNKVDRLYLSGLDAYSHSDYDTARSDWEEALSLDPGFDPAKQGLTLITHTQDVQKRIDAMTSLN
jgi:hypothetical protein